MNLAYLKNKNKLVFIKSNKIQFHLIKNNNNIYRSCNYKFLNAIEEQSFVYDFVTFFNRPNSLYTIEDYDIEKSYYSLMVTCVYRDLKFGIFDGTDNLLKFGLDVIKENMENMELIEAEQNKFMKLYNDCIYSEKDEFNFRFNRKKVDIKITIAKIKKI
jgi:hypothetical protein